MNLTRVPRSSLNFWYSSFKSPLTTSSLTAPTGSENGENPDLHRSHHTDTLWQHFQEIAKDHQNGVFAGTNDLVQKIGGKRPTGLQEFLQANRRAFLA